MQLVQKPELYDVLVLPNLYGDIVSDLAPGWSVAWAWRRAPISASTPPSSSPSTAPRPSTPARIGPNPTALILSAALMLRHLGEVEAGERVERAMRGVIGAGRVLPRDLGGEAGTQAFARAVADAVASAPLAAVS